jgi:hypothetical protein
MSNNRREVFSQSPINQVWIEGSSQHPDSKVLLTITRSAGEETALITPSEVIHSEAKFFV